MQTTVLNCLAAALLLSSCSTLSRKTEPGDVTMTELIANPAKHEGQTVRVIGFLHLEFEGNVLYAHKEDFDHAILGNGIWVHMASDKRDLSDNYVLLEGRFTARRHGHMGMWSGELQDITRSMIWSSPKEPRGKPRPTPKLWEPG